MLITSLENDKIKEINKLKDKKYRDESNLFLVEGENLVIEAYRAGIIKTVIVTDDTTVPFNLPSIYVSKEVASKLSDLDNPSNIFAVCYKLSEKHECNDKVIMLDNVQDPGNLGTIIRSALAFNIDTIVLGEGTVDLYNPKVIRATQGMMFFMNIVKKDIHEVIDVLKQDNHVIYGTDVASGLNVKTLNKRDKKKFALIVGNEGRGVQRDILEKCDVNLKITMNELVDSLNVGVAASILIYELSGEDNVS